MYPFAIAVLVGLVVAKLVHLVAERGDFPAALRSLCFFVLGLVASIVLDLNLFKMWGIHVRSNALGLIGTGLVFGSLAHVWHEVLGYLSGVGRKAMDEAMEIEAHRTVRAA